jgi:hypothetical protein
MRTFGSFNSFRRSQGFCANAVVTSRLKKSGVNSGRAIEMHLVE